MACLLFAFPLQAQAVSGLVQSPDGQPIPSALVVVWGSVKEEVRGTTSPTGRFTIALPEGAQGVILSVRAIGYFPDNKRLRPDQMADLVITLQPYAAPLPEIVARSVRPVCPNREETSARALWQTLRSRYQLTPIDSGWEAETRQSSELVTPEQVGNLDESRLMPGLQGVAGMIRSASEAFMRDSGYAASLAGPRTMLTSIAANSDRFASWWYPSLDRWDLEHWLRDSFGQRHILSVRSFGNGTSEISFCGRKGDASSVEGFLEVGVDTTLVRVDWLFRTKEPDEKAGGQVTFLPVTPGQAGRLVPVSSVVWRLVAGYKNMYLQDAATYSRWGSRF
jgi:hypothetical protein